MENAKFQVHRRFTDRSQFLAALSFLPFNLCQHELETSRNINAIQQHNDFQCAFEMHKHMQLRQTPHKPELWTTGRGNLGMLRAT
jgi:hypothetical protein